jgi:hypothetical protein
MRIAIDATLLDRTPPVLEPRRVATRPESH